MKFGLLKALCLVFNILVLLYVLTIGLLALVVGLLGRVITYFLLGTNNFLTEVFVIPRWMVEEVGRVKSPRERSPHESLMRP